MLKKIKKNFASTFVLVMVAAILVTPLTAYAASFTFKTKVNGDGVRLRATPGCDGVVLELMYKGEDITIASDVLPPSDLAVWMYTRREKTGTIGWMHWDYFDHDNEL